MLIVCNSTVWPPPSGYAAPRLGFIAAERTLGPGEMYVLRGTDAAGGVNPMLDQKGLAPG